MPQRPFFRHDPQIDSKPEAVLESLRRGGLQLFQLTPTASWWFKVNNLEFLRVISLGKNKPSTPTTPNGGWQDGTEYYFLDKGVNDIAQHLGTANIDVTRNCLHPTDPAQVTQCLQTDAALVTDATKYRFQMKGKSVLADSDWISGGPPATNLNPLQKFYRYKGAVGSDSPHLVLELNANKSDIIRITWLTKAKIPGWSSNFELEPWPTPPSSWSGWMYYSITP